MKINNINKVLKKKLKFAATSKYSGEFNLAEAQDYFG